MSENLGHIPEKGSWSQRESGLWVPEDSEKQRVSASGDTNPEGETIEGNRIEVEAGTPSSFQEMQQKINDIETKLKDIAEDNRLLGSYEVIEKRNLEAQLNDELGGLKALWDELGGDRVAKAQNDSLEKKESLDQFRIDSSGAKIPEDVTKSMDMASDAYRSAEKGFNDRLQVRLKSSATVEGLGVSDSVEAEPSGPEKSESSSKEFSKGMGDRAAHLANKLAALENKLAKSFENGDVQEVRALNEEIDRLRADAEGSESAVDATVESTGLPEEITPDSGSGSAETEPPQEAVTPGADLEIDGDIVVSAADREALYDKYKELVQQKEADEQAGKVTVPVTMRRVLISLRDENPLFGELLIASHKGIMTLEKAVQSEGRARDEKAAKGSIPTDNQQNQTTPTNNGEAIVDNNPDHADRPNTAATRGLDLEALKEVFPGGGETREPKAKWWRRIGKRVLGAVLAAGIMFGGVGPAFKAYADEPPKPSEVASAPKVPGLPADVVEGINRIDNLFEGVASDVASESLRQNYVESLRMDRGTAGKVIEQFAGKRNSDASLAPSFNGDVRTEQGMKDFRKYTIAHVNTDNKIAAQLYHMMNKGSIQDIKGMNTIVDYMKQSEQNRLEVIDSVNEMIADGEVKEIKDIGLNGERYSSVFGNEGYLGVAETGYDAMLVVIEWADGASVNISARCLQGTEMIESSKGSGRYTPISANNVHRQAAVVGTVYVPGIKTVFTHEEVRDTRIEPPSNPETPPSNPETPPVDTEPEAPVDTKPLKPKGDTPDSEAAAGAGDSPRSKHSVAETELPAAQREASNEDIHDEPESATEATRDESRNVVVKDSEGPATERNEAAKQAPDVDRRTDGGDSVNSPENKGSVADAGDM